MYLNRAGAGAVLTGQISQQFVAGALPRLFGAGNRVNEVAERDRFPRKGYLKVPGLVPPRYQDTTVS
jgi:hypothetical protein